MNETSIAVLTIILGETFLFSLMIISTLIIYYHFAKPNEPTIDIDSIEMSDQNENIISLKSQLEQFQ
ncbi:unnamed protein product [Rotaria sordida]|uniref:Uncharacterized protein n=1 Tax=Rotaria sordida TaxID=392033 RepID=A0A814PAW6_9BILA|nr:unnamed protein product [Rotaria sordida]CAF1102830.1 unnamed protein product [Rotaria sordida]CAF1277197.1 unnamed protein product [Rotaria sordida]CAF3676226.1 unnamed protein product [Rotaria sordida]CAF3700823.1 unnamed protein product [Rotaria sordida]